MTFDDIMLVYTGSDAAKTKALYARLQDFPPRGIIGLNLFRACKASERAKGYRSKYSAMAYQKKEWSIEQMCEALIASNNTVIQSWGWGHDPKAINFEHVVYIDVPFAGQVSFHQSFRGIGPAYPGRWDGARGTAPTRICRWVEAILNGTEVTTSEGESHAISARPEGVGPESDAGGRPEAQQETLHL